MKRGRKLSDGEGIAEPGFDDCLVGEGECTGGRIAEIEFLWSSAEGDRGCGVEKKADDVDR